MTELKLGVVEYINCWPVHYGFDYDEIDIDAKIVAGPPAELNEMFLRGEVDITPMSSIEYARNFDDCYILPDLAIASDGSVGSLFLFSEVQIEDFTSKTVALPEDSRSTVALLKILLERYYQVNVDYITCEQDLDYMLEVADAALLIGDPALNEYIEHQNSDLNITDLGAAWKNLTGKKMVYAIWVIRKEFADQHSELVAKVSNKLLKSKYLGLNQVELLAKRAKEEIDIPEEISLKYFKSLCYDFDEDYQKGVMKYFADAYELSLIDKWPKLHIWSEENGRS
ncbi:menaquinone biosynthetic enzyme MqnA/MqnD family protein [Sporohalobacter salinus]|uniref:menaquinone biosynthetic enzyme MqnA/MqnD family protein n=1 Tax=Sporohalobacter salinus TaxID=1494606 RepID=UPI00195FD696|nr:menaquinone biosynthesis protein [Sporohalobacter salinus]MBM7624834.1 chorismate dehydratase [Sporohalobacter salinus]